MVNPEIKMGLPYYHDQKVIVGSGLGGKGSEGISSVSQSPVSGFTPNSHCGCDRARRLG